MNKIGDSLFHTGSNEEVVEALSRTAWSLSLLAAWLFRGIVQTE